MAEAADDAFARGLARLQADRSHGAAELARSALDLLAELAGSSPATNVAALHARLGLAAAHVRAVRPSMAPVCKLAQDWEIALADLPATLPAARAHAIAAAGRLRAASLAAVDAIAVHAAALIGPGRRVLTHSFSSTVLASFARLREAGVAALVTEARPLNEGWTLAGRLAALGIPVTLFTDAQALLALAEADVLLLGADTRLTDGGCVNKVGTHALALAAHAAGVPCYVACEHFKRSAASAATVTLETMDPAELGFPSTPGVSLRNAYFEVTPGTLITAWITESGIEEGTDTARRGA